MDIFKITALSVCGAVCALILKEYKPPFAICIGIICAVMIFFEVLEQINYIFISASAISSQLSVNPQHMGTVIKITGVSCISRLGTEICRDAGQNAIASNLELAGKIIIVVLSLPVLFSVINLILGLL